MKDHPDNMSHYGTAYPIYFMFIKQTMVFVFIHFIISALPALIFYTKGDFCEK